MAKSRSESIDWWDHRYSMFFGFILFVVIAVHLLAGLFLPDGPRVEEYVDEQGRAVTAYYLGEASNPYRVQIEDAVESQVIDQYDRNENGEFESRHIYLNGVLSEQQISTFDNGKYDLQRVIAGDEVLEQYDRNYDGHYEERRRLRAGLRVLVEIDRNNDGNYEQRVFYDDAGGIERLELDYDSDGRVDMVYPRQGNPVPGAGS